MCLLDTNVVSELRKAGKVHRNVSMWAQAFPAASLYLSVVSILELKIGIFLVERRDRKQDLFFAPGWTGTFCAHSLVAFCR